MTYADGEFLHHYLTIKNTHDRGHPRRSGAGDRASSTRCWCTPAPPTPASSSPSCPGATATSRTTWPRTAGSPPSTARCCATCWSAKRATSCTCSPCVSPEWIGAGKTIAAKQVPTYFGKVAFTLTQPSAQEAVLKLDPQFTHAPAAIVVHIPWFVDYCKAPLSTASRCNLATALSRSPTEQRNSTCAGQ